MFPPVPVPSALSKAVPYILFSLFSLLFLGIAFYIYGDTQYQKGVLDTDKQWKVAYSNAVKLKDEKILGLEMDIKVAAEESRSQLGDLQERLSAKLQARQTVKINTVYVDRVSYRNATLSPEFIADWNSITLAGEAK